MPKALCLISLVASMLVLALFVADAAMGLLGMEKVAPLGAASLMMDLGFAFFSGIMIYLSWSTYREQR